MRSISICLQVTVLAAGALMAAACSKSKEDQAFYAQTVDRLRDKGLEVGELEPAAAKPYKAKQCVRGQVEQLDLLLCEYPDAAAAQKAEKKVQRFLAGAVSGALRRSATLLLAVADREEKDLQGNAIQKAVTAFSERE